MLAQKSVYNPPGWGTYEIDGQRFSTLEEFYGEIDRVLISGTDWGHNLEGSDDILRGGFGTPVDGFTLRWKHHDLSRERLGYPETVRQLEKRLERCHPTNRDRVQRDLAVAQTQQGPPVFDWLVEILAKHGAGGRGSRSVRPMTAIEAGAEFGPSSWIEMPQEKIQAFADTTDDHNFIHVDPEMAAQTPFGGTVAHGYLTLSLLPAMSYELLPHDEPGAGMALNYGLNKVRFPAPVPSGSRVRGTFRVDAVREEDWGRETTMTATIEREGGDKPVCVAEVVYRYYLL